MVSSLEALIAMAKEAGATDLHLEGGMPPALRAQGELKMVGDAVPASVLTSFARELLGPEGWNQFLERRSCDVSRLVQGARCRINVLHSARGVGFAIRLLPAFQATLPSLNLHPELRKLVSNRHGLIMVSGSTGSGKSSTLAALLQEINLTEARHILTIESPIEYLLTPRRSLIRQREVGRDTPSFEQALVDALREDPDVLMVGEMREPETMRLTLNAAETGHLVLTTLHSSSAAEALQRVVAAFPAEIQGGICAQLADCLVGIVCQRLRYRPEQKMLIPECELLLPSSGVRGIIRMGQFSKISTAMESGGQDGMWTFARYRAWLDARTEWAQPWDRKPEAFAAEPLPVAPPASLPAPVVSRPVARRSAPAAPAPRSSAKPQPTAAPPPAEDGVLVIDEMEDPEDILAQLKRG